MQYLQETALLFVQYTPNKPHLTIIAQKVVQYSTKTTQNVVQFITYNPLQEILRPRNKRQTIYLCLAHMNEAGLEQKYVKEAFDTNWVVPMGPNVAAYKEVITTAVGGAAGVIHAVDSAVTDCQPNANVEALRVFLVNWCPR